MRFRHLMPFWIFFLIIILLSAAATSCQIAESSDKEVSETEEAGDVNEAENQQQEEIGKELEGEEAELFFAEDYAKIHGVTVDEALRRFKLQDIAGKLSEDLITKEADTLAGYWIEHTPKFKLVVLFTSNAEETIKPYLQKYKELADIIEVGTAKMSLVELENIQAEISTELENLGIYTSSEVDVYKNRVKFYVADRTQIDSAVSEGKLILPGCVDVITVGSLAKLTAEIYGGLSLTGTKSGTSGFAVINSSGTRGITTAGHCSNDQFYNGSGLTFRLRKWETYYDIQWHTALGFTVTNKIRTNSGGTTMSITATMPRSQQWVGALVFKYGKSTGRTSGYISSLTVRPSSVPNAQATFIRVDNTNGYSPLCALGDSGGPWFTAYTAWGSQVGYPADDPNDAIYMAINYVSGIGVSVMTSP